MDKLNFAIAVKSFVVNDKQELLLIKRHNEDIEKPGAWEIPGGRLDPGESPFEGLKRETKEETGIDIDILNPLRVDYFTRKDGQTIVMIIFLCKYKSGKVKLSKEHTDSCWVKMDDAKLKITEFFQDLPDLYKKHFSDKI
jgi:mutator protein MutT